MTNKQKKITALTLIMAHVALAIAGVFSLGWTYLLFTLFHWFSFSFVRSGIGLLAFGVLNLLAMIFGYIYYGSIWAAVMPSAVSFMCLSVIFIHLLYIYVTDRKVFK